MTSTVLDGLVCLLLVSAAVVTVTTATPHDAAGSGRAPAVASTLATTTATVEYAPGANRSEDDDTEAALDRVTHGTLATLLARVAVRNATVGGSPLRAGDSLRRVVTRAVGGAVRTNHTRITAVWRPYPGASVRGRVGIGANPPPDVPVHAATLDVPSGFSSRRSAAASVAQSRGIDGVGTVVAAGIVRGLFPPVRTRNAAGGGDQPAALVRRRYARAARLFGASGSVSPADGGTDETNDRLAAALAERVARDIGRTELSPTASARAVRLSRVRITVRTWP